MIIKETIAIFRTILIDIITALISLSLSVLFSTIILIMLTGSREVGMGYGVIAGFCIGIVSFYYARRQFDCKWTMLHIIFNASITAGLFFMVIDLLENKKFSEKYDGYVLLSMTIPLIVSLNKMLLDYISKKILDYVQLRKK